MAIGIVTNPFGNDDDNTTTSSNPRTPDPKTQDTANNSPVDTISDTTNTDSIPTHDTNDSNDQEDTSWIQSHHPEATKTDQTTTIETHTQDSTQSDNNIEKQETQIPNLYIQADQEQQTSNQDLVQQPQENINTPPVMEANTSTDDGGFDMDDLLGSQEQTAEQQAEEKPTQDNVEETVKQDAHNNEAPSPTADPFVQTQNHTQDTEPKQESVPATTQHTTPAKKSSLIKRLALISAGCFGVLVLWFVIRTMFPAGIGATTPRDEVAVSIIEDIEEDIVQEELLEEEELGHSSDTRTEQEILIDELQEYTAVGTSFYELGRELKDRNMVRYALYIEKRSQDLLDELASNPDMDTSEVDALFRQFDDYLQTLREWQEQSGEPLPTVQRPDTQTGQDMIDILQEEEEVDTTTGANNPVEDILQDIPGFNSLFEPDNDDTHTGSSQQSTESEQPELSDR